MRRRKKLSRPVKTLRNFLLAAVAMLLLWVAGGCAPLTKEAVSRQAQRENLLSGGKIIYDWMDPRGNGQNIMYIYCGDVVLRTQYQWNLISYTAYESNVLKAQEGVAFFYASDREKNGGIFSAVGDLRGAAAGTLELTEAGRTSSAEPGWRYELDGVFKGDNLISFTVEGSDVLSRLFINGKLNYDYTLRLYDATGNELGVWTDAPETA